MQQNGEHTWSIVVKVNLIQFYLIYFLPIPKKNEAASFVKHKGLIKL